MTYDQRSSNENTAQYTTFGYWEKYDLIDYIDYVHSYAPEHVIGVWGTSFGGATAGLAMGEKDVERKVDFLILDCPVIVPPNKPCQKSRSIFSVVRIEKGTDLVRI